MHGFLGVWFGWLFGLVLLKFKSCFSPWCVRRSIWNELFHILRLKKKKKNEEVGSKWCWINVHWYTNIFSKYHVTNSEEIFIFKKRRRIYKSLCWQEFFSEVSCFSSLRSPVDSCDRKPLCFLAYVGWLYIRC